MLPEFVDYYRILQVHHDASQEVVEAAYRRLCKIYHPDVNHGAGALERMKEINEAYDTVGRADRRREYHPKWVMRQSRGFGAPPPPPRSQGAAPRQAPPRQPPPRQEAPRQEPPKKEIDEAQLALDDFFHAMIEGDWDRAYMQLTTVDRRNVALGDFREWKRTVTALFSMGSYAIKPFRRYTNCRVDDVLYPEVREYSVFVTDIDQRTGRVDEENVLKHVALDGGRWRVLLGYQDVRPITLRYKYLSENLVRIDPAQVYAEAVTRQDSETGLLSRRAFLERAEQEGIRSRRYGNPFAVGVLRLAQIAPPLGFEPENYARMCLTHAARAAAANLRQTDVVGRWGERELVVLFTETPKANAQFAIAKLLGRIHEGDELRYGLRWGLSDFDGFSVEDTILLAASDARARTTRGAGVEETTITVE